MIRTLIFLPSSPVAADPPQSASEQAAQPITGAIPRSRGSCPEPELLDADDHRVGAGKVLDVRVAEAGFSKPALTFRARVVEPAGRLDQHVQAHEQPER